MDEWIAVLTAQSMDTKTQHGFDEHWKFWAEIQKPEYKAVEKLLLIPSVSIAPRPSGEPRDLAILAAPQAGRFDLQGRAIRVARPAMGLAVRR